MAAVITCSSLVNTSIIFDLDSKFPKIRFALPYQCSYNFRTRWGWWGCSHGHSCESPLLHIIPGEVVASYNMQMHYSSFFFLFYFWVSKPPHPPIPFYVCSSLPHFEFHPYNKLFSCKLGQATMPKLVICIKCLLLCISGWNPNEINTEREGLNGNFDTFHGHIDLTQCSGLPASSELLFKVFLNSSIGECL